MLNLFILRHADSGWAEPGQRDIERCLSARGINQLDTIRDTMRDNVINPKNILCSKATRTKQTYSGIKNCIPDDAIVRYEASLYSGEVETYLEAIQTLPVSNGAMVVGHNPMCAGLCMQLAGEGDSEAMQKMELGFPSGTLAHIQFNVENWNEISPNTGKLVGYYSAS